MLEILLDLREISRRTNSEHPAGRKRVKKIGSDSLPI
jgi:hypothetical protein